MLAYFSQATEFTWIFVGFLVFLCLHVWFKRPINFPPGPRGFPLFGAIPLMGKYPERQIKKWSKQYGAVMSVRFGSKDMVVLNDFQSINQAFVKQQSKFSGRPHIPLIKHLNNGYGIIFVDFDDACKRQRKFGQATFRMFGVGKRSMETKILEEVSYMNEAIRNENGKPFDISEVIHNAAANNICSVILGKRFQYDDETFKEIIYRFTRNVNDPISNTISILLVFAPILMHIPPFSWYKGYIKDDVDVVANILRQIVKEHEETFDDGNIRDFIDAFIVEMKKNEDPSFFPEQLLCYVHDLFIAGTDTTSSTLYWSLLCLLHYPETQEKLYREVMKLFGCDGVISTTNRADMHYTNAFIEEIYRFRTLAPLAIQHKVNEDAELNGYRIPKDTMVTANLWAVHNDENLWTEPEQFRPERFLDEKGNFVRSNNVIAFSMGSRRCLGEQLARMEIFIFLVSMIQKFEFLPDPSANKLPDIEDGSKGTVFVAYPFQLVAKER